MRPANQGLDGDRLAVAQIDLGLVVEHQLLVLDGGAQLVDEHEAVAAVVDVGLVDLERSLPELGAVHRHVGAAHEPDAVGGVGRGDGDADARADVHAHGVEHEGLLDECGQALRRPAMA